MMTYLISAVVFGAVFVAFGFIARGGDDGRSDCGSCGGKCNL
jgi:hypothetical protein